MSRLDTLNTYIPVVPTTSVAELISQTPSYFRGNIELGNLFVHMIEYDYLHLDTRLSITTQILAH